MNIDEQSDPSQSYVSAPHQFAGIDLKPFSMGNRSLVQLIANPEDVYEMWLQCCLFVLAHDRLEVIKLTRNRDKARRAVLDWIDTVIGNVDEMKAALELAQEIIGQAQKEKVDPVAAGAEGNA